MVSAGSSIGWSKTRKHVAGMALKPLSKDERSMLLVVIIFVSSSDDGLTICGKDFLTTELIFPSSFLVGGTVKTVYIADAYMLLVGHIHIVCPNACVKL